MCVLIASVLYSCSEIDSGSDKGQLYPDLSTLGLTKAHGEIAVGQMDFGVDFFKKIAENSNLDNVLVSPFSMSLDLSMLASGATDQTYNELVSCMGFKDFTPKQIGEYYSAILNYDCSDQETMFKSANALWINTNAGLSPSLIVKDSFKNEVKNLYDADVQSFDFGIAQMTKVINDWAKDNTDGLIDKVISVEPEPLAAALLTNALYFNGKWADGPFSKTVKDFVNIEGEHSEHDYFKGSTYALGYNTEWKMEKEPAVIAIPYGKPYENNNFRFFIIVPPATDSFAGFVNNLSASKIRKWMKNLVIGADPQTAPEVKMNFYVPMFQNDFSSDKGLCKTALKEMGINRIFGPNAQLSKISDGDILVSRMVQKTSIGVDEKGTVAAAVSYIEISGPTGIPPQVREYDFVVNRPFVYMIMDDYQSILFMGTVTSL